MEKKEYSDTVQKGQHVIYFDPTGKKRPAVVIAVWGVTNPSINVVYVNDDDNQSDTYGNKIERSTSVPHRFHQQAHGNYWLPL